MSTEYNSTDKYVQPRNTTNNNVIQHNKNRMIQFRINDIQYNKYNTLKTKYSFRNDSDLLRLFVDIGIVVVPWLKENNLFVFNSHKLTKILAGLTIDEKAELLELLRQDLQV